VERDPVKMRHTQFERLYEQHSATVARYCLRRTRSTGLADDACSETFLVAWRRFDDIPDEPLPWLLAVARRVVGNLVRGDVRREALRARLCVTASEWTAATDEHRDLALDDALAELGEPDREALMLIYWDGLTSAEAATAMDTTATAMRVRLYRARRRLELMLRSRQKPVDLRLPAPTEELR
jgi:RNA polymerase sigma-70 factor (ECF subfamily)